MCPPALDHFPYCFGGNLVKKTRHQQIKTAKRKKIENGQRQKKTIHFRGLTFSTCKSKCAIWALTQVEN